MRKGFFKKNRGLILAFIGIGGFIWTGVDIAIQSFKAKEHYDPDASLKEKFVHLFPFYIRPTIETIIASVCIAGGAIMDHKQIASLTGAAAMIAHKFAQYRKANIENNGIEADKKAIDTANDGKYQTSPSRISSKKELYYDEFSDTFFISSEADVLNAMYQFNCELDNGPQQALSLLYDILGIKPKRCNGDDFYWDKMVLIEEFDYYWLDYDDSEIGVTEDGRQYRKLVFPVAPMPNSQKQIDRLSPIEKENIWERF